MPAFQSEAGVCLPRVQVSGFRFQVSGFGFVGLCRDVHAKSISLIMANSRFRDFEGRGESFKVKGKSSQERD